MPIIRSACLLVALTTHVLGQQPFLNDHQWTALREESSGAAPYENLRYLTGLHRVPATADFDQAAQFVLQRAREYGLADVHSEQFAIDGTKPYGLMRSYLGLDGRRRTLVGGSSPTSTSGRLEHRSHPSRRLQPQRRSGSRVNRRGQWSERGRLFR